MKKRILKTIFAIGLVLCLVASLASCATTSSGIKDAESMEGDVDGTSIDWSYDADSKTLTIDGEGDIPDCESPADVWWYAVRHCVEEIEISDGITSIGDYAFYYCPELEKIEIPQSVTSFGELSFAFCSSLEALELPAGLESIGDSCFEACTSLGGIYVPATVCEIGERAFALCSDLEEVIVMAQIDEIKPLTFMECKAIDKLCFNESVQQITVADDAFEGARKGFNGAEFTASLTGEATLTVKYVFAGGETAHETYTEQLKYGSSYSVPSPTIEGYTASDLTVSGVVSSFDTIIEVKYTADEIETEAETKEAQTVVETEEAEDPVNVGNVIAIVILAVVIVGIVVLAIFMMRSDKKQSGTGNRRK